MADYKLTKSLKEAIRIAQAIAKEYSHSNYSSPHLLKALMHKDIGLLKYLEKSGQDGYYVEEWAEVRLESYPKTSKIPETIEADSLITAVLYEADNIRVKLGLDEVDEHCALISLCTPGVGFTFEQLKSFSISPNELIDALTSTPSGESNDNIKNKTTETTSTHKTATLSKYCINKNSKAQTEELEKISGRDLEIKTILEILGRRSKPNVLILGDPGVGKTALFNGLAYAMINDHAPNHLKSAKVYELDFIHLISGATYKGEVEDRLKKVLEELKQFQKAILFVDEFNNLTDKNSGNQGLANLLKSELSKGELTIIGTATHDAYRKYIEPDTGLTRQFEIVKLAEPSEEVALKMIHDSISYYTQHHGLEVDLDTIQESIRLAKRYSKERSLPDAAIDLLDRTMSAATFMIQTSLNELNHFEQQLKAITSNKVLDDSGKMKELIWLRASLKNKLSYLLLGELEDDLTAPMSSLQEGVSVSSKIIQQLKDLASKEKKAIDKNDVASTIANKTGIPTGKLQDDEKNRLLNIESHLKKRVIGQDHAVEVISTAVLESRSGLSKPGLPVGSFFFSGPTGTGKTELAKSLAEFLFQDENSIIRFDMSEFKEEHSAALLYGAPPGYVGYEEGGLLVNKIRQKPYSIVLFDEIEKAHPSVFDIFLQILDEGKLHDRLGKEGDFSNAVILFTSNIGSDHIVKSFDEGIIPKSNDLLEIMGQYFRPEFLGRLTEIIPFSPITKDNIIKIFEIQLKGLFRALEKQEITLNISEKAIEQLAYSGFTPKYGARPLRGVIRNQLRSPLSKKIISGEIGQGSVIELDIDAKNNLLWKI